MKLTLPNLTTDEFDMTIEIRDGHLFLEDDSPDPDLMLGQTSMWMIYQLLKDHFNR